MIYILIILLIAVQAWREIQILIDRKSYKAEDYRKLFWYTDWRSKWKNWDSFHVSNGIATLIICYFISLHLDSIGMLTGLSHWVIPFLNTIAYWLIWMQIRNLFMKLCRK